MYSSKIYHQHFGKNSSEERLNLETTMDLVTQDSYDKRHKQSTIPPALARKKEIEKNRYKKYNCETNKTTRNIPTRQRSTITVETAGNKFGHHNTKAPERLWNVATATK